MANDEINDLIGRYATGSLTAEEQRRLYDAALDDQDLFDQLAHEEHVKQLLAEPGARDRLIHALAPPRRKTGWIFGVAATAALTVVIGVFLMRPTAPKPAEVAVAKPSAAVAIESAPQKAEAPAPAIQAPKPPTGSTTVAQPSGAPEASKRKIAAEEPARDALRDSRKDVSAEAVAAEKKADESRVLDRKEKDQVAAAPVAPPPPPAVAPQAAGGSASQYRAQNAPGGPRQENAQQNAQQNKVGALGRISTLAKTAEPSFGIHYSIETPGHLILIPSADGFLSVKSKDGVVLFAQKRIAAGIVLDLALPESGTSVSIVFSASAAPQETTPVKRSDQEGTVRGSGNLAIDLEIKPRR